MTSSTTEAEKWGVGTTCISFLRNYLAVVWLRGSNHITWMVSNLSESDEGGYRMQFAVLYNEDILVEINVKGAEPEYIFNQLVDINQQ